MLLFTDQAQFNYNSLQCQHKKTQRWDRWGGGDFSSISANEPFKYTYIHLLLRAGYELFVDHGYAYISVDTHNQR